MCLPLQELRQTLARVANEERRKKERDLAAKGGKMAGKGMKVPKGRRRRRRPGMGQREQLEGAKQEL